MLHEVDTSTLSVRSINLSIENDGSLMVLFSWIGNTFTAYIGASALYFYNSSDHPEPFNTVLAVLLGSSILSLTHMFFLVQYLKKQDLNKPLREYVLHDVPRQFMNLHDQEYIDELEHIRIHNIMCFNILLEPLVFLPLSVLLGVYLLDFSKEKSISCFLSALIGQMCIFLTVGLYICCSNIAKNSSNNRDNCTFEMRLFRGQRQVESYSFLPSISSDESADTKDESKTDDMKFSEDSVTSHLRTIV